MIYGPQTCIAYGRVVVSIGARTGNGLHVLHKLAEPIMLTRISLLFGFEGKSGLHHGIHASMTIRIHISVFVLAVVVVFVFTLMAGSWLQ